VPGNSTAPTVVKLEVVSIKNKNNFKSKSGIFNLELDAKKTSTPATEWHYKVTQTPAP
jgi:hypothetical protein